MVVLSDKSQNKEIEQQKEELSSQKDALAHQNEEISQQKDRLQATFENIQLLSDIGREITSHITVEKINNAVYMHVNTLMDATGFGIGIYNENMDRLEFPGYIEEEKIENEINKLLGSKLKY